MVAKATPDGFHSVTPYLTVEKAARLIDFLAQSFEAQEGHRTTRPDGSIWHTEVKIGDSIIELSDASEKYAPMPCSLHLYVDDTDATYARALTAGATSLYEPADMDYGERSAGVKDPSGNHWYIATYQAEK
jgi:PhnB protein